MSLKIIALAGLIASAAFPLASQAQAVGLGLAQANNCVACHQVDRKRVGPAFRIIAERFQGDAQASDYLVNSILNGSRSRWGAIPMPAQKQVSGKEAQALAEWILSLADDKAADD